MRTLRSSIRMPEWTVDASQFKSKSKNTPFNGWKLKGQGGADDRGGKTLVRIADCGVRNNKYSLSLLYLVLLLAVGCLRRPGPADPAEARGARKDPGQVHLRRHRRQPVRRRGLQEACFHGRGTKAGLRRKYRRHDQDTRQQTGMAKFWEMSKPVTAPYFLTVGNHDAYPKVPQSEKIYKEQVDLPGNELYYSFTAGNSLFVVLDSYLDDQEKKSPANSCMARRGPRKFRPETHLCLSSSSPLYRPGQGPSRKRQPGPVSGKTGTSWRLSW